MVVDQNDQIGGAPESSLPSVKNGAAKIVMRGLQEIDQFPEIISQTSVKELSERDFGIRKEPMNIIQDYTTERPNGKLSDGYSNKKQKASGVDVPNLKKKLIAMKKRL